MKEIITSVFLFYLSILNIVTFFTYGIDKWKAKKNRWRIRERTLFLLAFFGGSAGAALGMIYFRHKTKHTSFIIGIPAIIIFHLILFFKFSRFLT